MMPILRTFSIGVSRAIRKKLLYCLPAVMCKSSVRLCHPMSIFAFLDRTTPVRRRLKNLVGQPLAHRFLTACARRRHHPPHRQRRSPQWTHFNRHLVVRAADAPRPYFNRRTHIVERPLEYHQTALFGAIRDQLERSVEDLLGYGLLAPLHHDVDKLRDRAVVELRIRCDIPNSGLSFARHNLSTSASSSRI